MGGTRRPLPCLVQGRPAARLLQEEQEGGDDDGVGSPSPQAICDDGQVGGSLLEPDCIDYCKLVQGGMAAVSAIGL